MQPQPVGWRLEDVGKCLRCLGLKEAKDLH